MEKISVIVPVYKVEQYLGRCVESLLAQTYENVEMQVRGVNEPTEVFARLKKDLNARIFDMHGGKFITADSSSGFNEWKEFTDKINLCEEI